MFKCETICNNVHMKTIHLVSDAGACIVKEASRLVQNEQMISLKHVHSAPLIWQPGHQQRRSISVKL